MRHNGFELFSVVETIDMDAKIAGGAGAREETSINKPDEGLVLDQRRVAREHHERALKELYYFDQGLDYRNGVVADYDGSPEARTQALATNLIEKGAESIRDILADLRMYVDIDSKLPQPARYTIPCDDQTLAVFLSCGTALEHLCSQDRTRPDVQQAIRGISGVWQRLAGELVTLDEQARNRGNMLDANDRREQRRAGEEQAWEGFNHQRAADEVEYHGPYDREEDRDEDDDPGQEEGVANWMGATGGNWT